MIGKISVFLFILLSFTNLSKKYYWGDEVYSSFRIAGVTEADVTNKISRLKDREITLGELRRIIEKNENSGTSQTLHSLITDETQHSPLFFLLGHLWAESTNFSPTNLRLLSAMLGLLQIPFIFLLGWEIFETSDADWLLLLLFVSSPVRLIYSQQVREYGFLMAMLAASLYFFLRANRRSASRSDWLLFSLSFLLSLYTSIISILLLPPFLFFMLKQKPYWRVSTCHFFTATTFSLLLFAPWLVLIFLHWNRMVEVDIGFIHSLPISIYVQNFLLNISRLFFDAGLLDYTNIAFSNPFALLPALMTIIVICLAIFSIWRESPSATRTFLLGLLCSGMFSFVLLDILLGGRRAIILRYLSIAWLACYLLVARFFIRQFRRPSSIRKYAGAVCFCLMLAFGAYSQLSYLGATSWWTSKPNSVPEQLAKDELRWPIIFLEKDMEVDTILSIAEFLPENRPAWILGEARIPEASKFPQKFLIYRPSEGFKAFSQDHGKKLTSFDRFYLVE